MPGIQVHVLACRLPVAHSCSDQHTHQQCPLPPHCFTCVLTSYGTFNISFYIQHVSKLEFVYPLDADKTSYIQLPQTWAFLVNPFLMFRALNWVASNGTWESSRLILTFIPSHKKFCLYQVYLRSCLLNCKVPAQKHLPHFIFRLCPVVLLFLLQGGVSK